MQTVAGAGVVVTGGGSGIGAALARRFTAEGHHYRLILSVGAPTSEERRRLMPIEDRWPLADVMASV